MALVEDSWFSVVLLGNEDAAPWLGVDWDSDPDWEFRTAADDSPEVLLGLLDDAIAASNRILDEIGDDLDRRAVKTSRREGKPFDLRWIMIHMIEEYARHNGHADLIRESIDGATGDVRIQVRDWCSAEHVAVRILEPRGLLVPELADVVDGLELGEVVVLERDAAALERGDLAADVVDLEAHRRALSADRPSGRGSSSSVVPPAEREHRAALVVGAGVVEVRGISA